MGGGVVAKSTEILIATDFWSVEIEIGISPAPAPAPRRKQTEVKEEIGIDYTYYNYWYNMLGKFMPVYTPAKYQAKLEPCWRNIPTHFR